ncbi:Protein of unknown function [Thermomonospora echinospora]|uniref:DUF2786 domain-containing protein n=1 Tax=Thermomonospora echinospora TaxID=1992 RepID=A0A1H6DGV7_9ACTN|nr:DUF2786 domain-containing protein [Thermomonospora echinospora]SEG83983.1 Protein of unknown function [Thermomonospora echinospora]
MDAERIEARVRALLARAEHPATPRPEAEAAHAKAAELMLRHALDEAALRADQGQVPDPAVYWERIAPGGGGHARARTAAAGAVIKAYGGRYAVRGDGTRGQDITLLIVTTRAARDALLLLLPSLELQMEGAGRRETDAYMATVPKDAFARRSDRSRWANNYFRAFIVGYGDAVARRIEQARQGLLAQDGGGSSRALVLAGEDRRVAAEFAARFPELGRPRVQRLRADGYRAGRVAGDRADLGDGRLGASRPAITP